MTNQDLIKMTSLERAVILFYKKLTITHEDIRNEYPYAMNLSFLSLIYGCRNGDYKVASRFDWLYVHIIYLRIENKSIV